MTAAPENPTCPEFPHKALVRPTANAVLLWLIHLALPGMQCDRALWMMELVGLALAFPCTAADLGGRAVSRTRGGWVLLHPAHPKVPPTHLAYQALRPGRWLLPLSHSRSRLPGRRLGHEAQMEMEPLQGEVGWGGVQSVGG